MGNNVKFLSSEGLRVLVENIKKYIFKTLSESISYDNLFGLVESGELIPGKKYRINDYFTIVNTSRSFELDGMSYTCDSIGMTDEIGFDIVVTALTNDKLSEEAFAIDRDNDYFSTSNLSAWKIWYTIYNDVNKYSWANEDEGRGVIYRMIDEYGNDIPYDFKSIKFMSDQYDEYVFTFTWIDEDGNIIDSSIAGNDGTLAYNGEIHGVTNNIIKPYYSPNDEALDDNTYNKQFLNNIVFISDCSLENKGNEGFNGCYSNTFGDCCYFNSFGDSCHSNTFGFNCSSNNFANYCYCNTFGDFCSYNSLGNSCYANSFKHGCYGNGLGSNCCANTFDFSCSNNNFDANCCGNTLGAYCDAITLGDTCVVNTFGAECSSITFGTGCYCNTFGSQCSTNTLGDECYSNNFGDECHLNTFGNQCHSNTVGNQCQSNTFVDGCQFNSFGTGCNSNTFGNQCHSNTFGNQCYSNTFGNECYGNTFGFNCRNNEFNSKCSVNTFGNECGNNKFNGYCTFNNLGNYCFSNELGYSCSSNTFGVDCYGNTLGDYCYYNNFGGNCDNNSFRMGDNTSQDPRAYCYNNHFDDECSYNIIWNGATANSYYILQNIHVKRGVAGTSGAYNKINIKTLNNTYCTTVAKTSSNELLIYCEEDYVTNDEIDTIFSKTQL